MIVDAADVREILKSPVTDDVMIGKMIARKQKVMENYIRRVIEEASYDEYYDMEEGMVALNLDHFPVTEFTGMWRVSITDEVVINSTYYHVYEDRGIVQRLAGTEFSGGMRSIRVKYKAGWVNGKVPEDLKDACIDLVCAQYTFSQLMVHEVEADSATEKKRVLEEGAWKVLDMYKGMRV